MDKTSNHSLQVVFEIYKEMARMYRTRDSLPLCKLYADKALKVGRELVKRRAPLTTRPIKCL